MMRADDVRYLPAAILPASTLMPGPMVEERVILLMYFPLLVLGFAFIMESTTTLALSRSAASSKESFPIWTWTMPAFSVLYSTFPAFISLTAF